MMDWTPPPAASVLAYTDSCTNAHFVLYLRLTRLDFPAAMTLPPLISMMDRDTEPMLAGEPRTIHAPTPSSIVIMANIV